MIVSRLLTNNYRVVKYLLSSELVSSAVCTEMLSGNLLVLSNFNCGSERAAPPVNILV